jgi:hypothetical protein
MLTENEIQNFSREIAGLLSNEKDVELLQPLSAIEEKITAVITGNMEEERRINTACDKIMDQYAREIERGSVDPHQMFLMIKKKLAKEKGFVL